MKESKRAVKALFYFLIFIFFINIVFAQQFSYSTKSSNGPLCPRESGLFIDSILNTDSVSKDFTIKLTGSASSWSTSLPVIFNLAPGQSKGVYTYTTPLQDINPGNYDLNIEVSSSTQTSIIRHSIIVKECFNSQLIPSISTLSSCPSQIQNYQINLVNHGEFTETYKLSINNDNIKNNIRLSESEITLDKNQQKTIYLFVTAPVESKEYNFELTADAGKNKVVLPLTFIVQPCYDFNFYIEDNNTNFQVCSHTATILPFRVVNGGTTSNNYNINIDGPNWVKSEYKSYNLLPNESKRVNIAFAPNYNANGTYKIDISALPSLGYSKIVNTFYVDVKNCDSVQIKFLQNNAQICTSTQNVYTAKITNTGSQQKIFDISINAPQWFILNNNSNLILKPGASKDVTFNVNPDDSVKDGNYKAKVSVKSNDESSVVDNSQDTLNIEVSNLAQCYQGVISTRYDDVVVYSNSNIAIPISIKNNGIRNAEYQLSLSGNATSFIRLNPNKVTILPDQEETMFLYVAPNTNTKLGMYNLLLTTKINEQTIGEKSFKLEVTDVQGRATQIILNPAEETTVSTWERIKSFVKQYKIQIIVIVILFILLDMFILFGWHKKVIDFFEEDEEETSEKSIEKEETKIAKKTRRPRKKKEIPNLSEENKDIKEEVNK